MKNKTITKLTIIFTLFMTSSILITSICLAVYFRNTLLDNASKQQASSLSRLNENINYMDSSAKVLLLQLYYDNSIRQLLTYEQLNGIEIQKNLFNMTIYYQYMPNLNSFYIINQKFGYIFSTYGTKRINDFPDKNIFSVLKSPSGTVNFKPISRTMTDFSDMQQKKVYTDIYSDKYDGKISDYAIAVNFSEDWLQKTAGNLCDKNECILIYKTNSDIVLKSNPSFKIYGTNLLKNIKIPSDAKEGYLTTNLNGQQTLISYMKADEKGWIIIKLTPYGTIVNSVTRMLTTTILICAILLILGIILALVSSRRIYEPVEELFHRVNTLEKENIKQYPLLKEFIMRMLADPKYQFDLNETEAKIKEYGLKINVNKPLVTGLLRIDEYFKFCNDYDLNYRNTLKYAVVNIAKDVFEGTCDLEGVSLDYDSIFIVLSNFGENGLREDHLDELIRSVMGHAKEILHLSFSVGFSRPGKFEELYELYSEAASAADYRYIFGHESVMFYSSVQKSDDKELVSSSTDERQLAERLLLLDIAQSREITNDLLDRSNGCSCSFAKDLKSRIIFTVKDCLQTLQDRNLINFFIVLQFINEQSATAETLDEIKAMLNKTFDMIEQTLNENSSFSEQKYVKLLNSVENCIKDNYSDLNLSLDNIADRMNMSSVYLGQIFKKFKGYSIASYINEVRLTKASELLLKTNQSIKEIAEQCGIDNVPYFYTLFKKYYNLTPKEYRQVKS